MTKARRRIDMCQYCLQPEDDHHHFKPVLIPLTCKCDPRDWGNITDVPDVCDSFKPIETPDDRYCQTCAHDKRCH